MGLLSALFYGCFYRRILQLWVKFFSKSYEKIDLKGKNVLVTGAASGLGRQVALDLIQMPKYRRPTKIFLWDINSLEEFQNMEPAEILQIDLCDYQKVSKQIISYSQSNQNLDIVFQNAGVAAGKILKDLTFEQYFKTIDVNFLSCVNFTKSLMEHHQPQHVLYTSSVAAFVGESRGSEYCPSKHAIRSFAHACRREYNYKIKPSQQIKFQLILPYFAKTNMTKHIAKKLDRFAPLLVTPKDVSRGFFDCLYYGFDELIIGWAGYVLKWTTILLGEAHRPSS